MDQENANESENNCTINCDVNNDSTQVQKEIFKTKMELGKKTKRGIIYLSTIPKYMNVTMIREIFSAYGKVGRVYLQLTDNGLFYIFTITFITSCT